MVGQTKSALKRAIQAWHGVREKDRPTTRQRSEEGEIPTSFELVTRRGLDDLTRQVERMETKINGLLIALASSILIDLYRTLAR